MKEQTWQEFKIKIPSKRDGKEIEFTLEQLFNDLELGNALAEDLQLPYEKRLEAFNWLKSNVFQFISELIDKTREETIREERKRIYCYVEEMLIGSDNELLKDLSNIIFNKTN